ncbi:MAG: hypothetical protein HY716_13675 [Planctomycetes bacterium]|nr:hypothetical protein [Planctomycetota bacterium]
MKGILLGVMLPLGSAAAQDLHVEVRPAAGASWLRGRMTFDEKPARGDSMDLEDLGTVVEVESRLTRGSDRFGVRVERAVFSF